MIKILLKQKNKNNIIVFISIITAIYLLTNQSYGQSSLGLKLQIEKIEGLNELSNNFVFVNNFLALQLANEALAQSISVNYMKGKAIAFNDMSSVSSEQFLFRESIDYIKKALNILEVLNEQEGIENCNIFLGHTLKRLGQDSVAYLFYQKVFDFFQTSGNTRRMITTSHNLGQVLQTHNDQFNTKVYLSEALKYIKELKNYQLSSTYLNYLGDIELKKKYDEKVRSNEINEKIIGANSNVIKILIVLSLCLTGLLIVIVYQFFINKRNTDSLCFIFENAGIAIILIDEKGGIIKWNKFSSELFGEKLDRVKGKNFFEEFVLKQDDLSPGDLEMSFLNELIIILPNGRTKEISVSCFKTFINTGQFYVLFILDTSEFKRMERLNIFYRDILEKCNEIAKIGTWEILLSKFRNKEMPTLSSKCLEILGLDNVNRDRLSTIFWTSFFKSEESVNRMIDVVQKSLSADQPFDIELELLSYAGNEIWVRLIGNIEQITKNDFKLYGTVQDITETKNGIKLIEENLAKELELNKLKSKFISMASHEFRTPLATITSSVELIKINLDKITVPSMEVFARHTNGILHQIDRLEHTLNGILMLEKTKQGKIDIMITQVDLSKLLLELVESAVIIGDPRKPDLCLNKTRIILNTDPHILNHILQNIISNALKYSKGKQEPIIKAFELDKVIIIEVQDFGIGIPESDKSKLFNSFFRATNTSGINGTGLGLSIVKEFVTLLKAEISIESQEGVGTKVTLTLPITY